LTPGILVVLCFIPGLAGNPGERDHTQFKGTAWVGCTREEINSVWGTETSSGRDGEMEVLIYVSVTSPRQILRRLIADEASSRDDDSARPRPLPIVRMDPMEVLRESGKVYIIASFSLNEQGVVEDYFIVRGLEEHPRVQPPPSCRKENDQGWAQQDPLEESP
jgi:hypothetical protein